MNIFKRKNQPNIGVIGENIAEKYLKKNGYKIIKRNYKNTKGKTLGEIDIIAKDQECLVFIEVKTRTGDKNSIPEEAINRAKLLKLRKVAENYIKNKRFWRLNHRFDAISITIPKGEQGFKIKHIESIFIDI